MKIRNPFQGGKKENPFLVSPIAKRGLSRQAVQLALFLSALFNFLSFLGDRRRRQPFSIFSSGCTFRLQLPFLSRRRRRRGWKEEKYLTLLLGHRPPPPPIICRPDANQPIPHSPMRHLEPRRCYFQGQYWAVGLPHLVQGLQNGLYISSVYRFLESQSSSAATTATTSTRTTTRRTAPPTVAPQPHLRSPTGAPSLRPAQRSAPLPSLPSTGEWFVILLY